jgi:hypothetical protein
MTSETIAEVTQCASLLVGDLRAAIKAADPVTALLIEQHLFTACRLHNALDRLQYALSDKQEG